MNRQKNFFMQIQETAHCGRIFIKWIFLSCIVGFVVGAFAILFSKCMTWATATRTLHPNLVFLLPFAGLFIVLLYRTAKVEDKGTNLVLSTIHAKEEIPFRIAPLIVISTVITHLFGGSAGREGAALQLGGSIANRIGRFFHLSDKDRYILVMSGMSAAFSALFGTPIAASLFSIEVASVGLLYYGALFPCVVASFIASGFASHMKIAPETFPIHNIPSFAPSSAFFIGFLAILCAIVSMFFCFLLHYIGSLYKKYIKNPYLRITIGGFLILIFTLFLHTTDYLGAGMNVIERAVEGEVKFDAFFWKMLLTALTLGAGFKGGEIVPTFFVGATFGCMIGNLFGFSPSLCAAVGMTALFCGVTNCPLSSFLISLELFGFDGAYYFVLACAVSYLLSGYFGLYHEQHIVYSKYTAEYTNKHVH